MAVKVTDTNARKRPPMLGEPTLDINTRRGTHLLLEALWREHPAILRKLTADKHNVMWRKENAEPPQTKRLTWKQQVDAFLNEPMKGDNNDISN